MTDYSSTKARLSPIFLFSNWRTGGTALAFTFRNLDQFYVYSEPFNPTLRNADLALKANTSGWESKHPAGQYYFKEFEPLLKSSDFFFPSVEQLPYILGAKDVCDDLYRYLKQLIDYANMLGKTPVFKFEQLEGSAAWIAANFPDGLRVGVTRDPLRQLISWVEQASFGNDSFFQLAHRLIQNNPNYFDVQSISPPSKRDIETLKNIFYTFRRRIDIQHQQYMNFCIDIAPETTESIELQIEKITQYDPCRIFEWTFVLNEVRRSCRTQPEAEVALNRLSFILALLEENKIIKEESRQAQEENEALKNINSMKDHS